MALPNLATANGPGLRASSDDRLRGDAGPLASAVSWGAIVAGAAAAAALSLILLVLGVGLGLSSVSPWAREGASAGAIGVGAILWITFTQIAASGMGGYIAGRLRTRWELVHEDEIYFRDTAHGFLAWAVASLVTAAMLTSAVGSIISGGVQAGAAMTGGAATAAAGVAMKQGSASGTDGAAGEVNYFVDSMFRKDLTKPVAAVGSPGMAMAQDTEKTNAATTAESARIFISGALSGALQPDDVRYLGQVVAARTGLSQADAEKRVSETFARMDSKRKDAEIAAREAADKARKASAYSALWLFISLLIGAFVASWAATFGGNQRRA